MALALTGTGNGSLNNLTLPDETGTLRSTPSSSKVGFRVVNSSAVVIVNAATDYTLTLDTNSGTATNFGTCFDLGANFNTTNYKFTAPVTGYYMLTFCCYFLSNSDSSRYIRVRAANQNGDWVFYQLNTLSNETGDADYNQVVYMGVTFLNANDTLINYVGSSQGSSQVSVGAGGACFSGWLLG